MFGGDNVATCLDYSLSVIVNQLLCSDKLEMYSDTLEIYSGQVRQNSIKNHIQRTIPRFPCSKKLEIYSDKLEIYSGQVRQNSIKTT